MLLNPNKAIALDSIPHVVFIMEISSTQIPPAIATSPDTASEPLILANWFAQELCEANDHAETVAYSKMLALTGQICIEMERQGIKRKDLAERLGVSKGWISRFLNAPPNMSIEKLVEMGMALGLELSVTFIPTGSKHDKP